MTYEEYLAKRNELMNNARKAFSDGKKEEAMVLKDQIPALDDEYKAQCDFEANLNALDGVQAKVNMQNMAGVQVNVATAETTAPVTMTKEDAMKSNEYVTAWAKRMQNKPLTVAEEKTFQMVNAEGSASADAYTHDTTNTAILIPTTVAAGIWKEIEEKYPFYADTKKTFIKGKAVIIKAKESSEAKWYVESVKTEDGKELFSKIELDGCELARAITVSWKLKEMAIADFIAYVISSMAEQMGKGLAYGMAHGAGVVSGHAREPLGIVTALNAEENTPHVTGSSASAIDYDTLVSARSKVKSGYRPAIYCNANTMWNALAKLVDANGRPMLMADATASGGVYRVLGCVVKEDDSFDDGEILFGDASQYQVNINKQVTITTEEHNKERTTDYCGYAICDGAPITLNAFSLLLGKVGE